MRTWPMPGFSRWYLSTKRIMTASTRWMNWNCRTSAGRLRENGKVILKNKTKGTEIPLDPVLTGRQRELVLAGGLLNYTREQNT